MFVCILPGKAVPEMTYTVSDETLNPTHSLSTLLRCSVMAV